MHPRHALSRSLDPRTPPTRVPPLARQVAVLSEKLRQLLRESTELRATVAQRDGDIDVLSQEILRMRADGRAAVPPRAAH